VFSHAGYCQPSCPGRKIDPAGPTPSHPDLGGTSGCRTWQDSAFRSYLDALVAPTPPPTPTTEDEDMLYICKVGSTYYVGDGVRATAVAPEDVDTMKANVEGNGTNRWHQPARTGLPLVKNMADIVTINAGQRDCLLGHLD
jgi:hypothetical protein